MPIIFGSQIIESGIAGPRVINSAQTGNLIFRLLLSVLCVPIKVILKSVLESFRYLDTFLIYVKVLPKKSKRQ